MSADGDKPYIDIELGTFGCLGVLAGLIGLAFGLSWLGGVIFG